MERTTSGSADIPTALPGFEDYDAREKLLLEKSSDELEDAVDEESIDFEGLASKPRKRRWRLLGTLAAFAIFISLLAVGIAWFFGMGWFSSPQTQTVKRRGQKDAQTLPVTEDEKLKMALSLIAPSSSPSVNAQEPNGKQVLEENTPNTRISDLTSGNGDIPPEAGIDQAKKIPNEEKELRSLPRTAETSADNITRSETLKAVSSGNDSQNTAVAMDPDSEDARGRSLFFGISRKPFKEEKIQKPAETGGTNTVSLRSVQPPQIPFGTLLPVRLVGSIYTLSNSGGFVRMELTRPVEGKSYTYPAGTMIVGNVRGGESVRAFVTIVGLIDPLSGELVKFSGELLGRDGSSGIEGHRRNLTSQWTRVFRGMKDTAATVLGSVGTLRSGGSTVILSEPVRRGTESMAEDLSGTYLKNEHDDTFLEVAAGSNGYVLVTNLPENSAAIRQPAQEAKE